MSGPRMCPPPRAPDHVLSIPLQTEGRPPFADVSLTLWRELAMLTAPTAGQLENVPIAVTLQDYAVGFVAVQVQEQLQWNGANNMMEKVQQGAAGRAAGLGGEDRAHRHPHRQMQKTARTPWSSSSRAGWSSAGQPGLPMMLAVESAALHEYFESGLRSWRPSSPRSAASDGARQAQRRAHHVRRDATEVGAWHWPSAAKVLPICTHTCTILPGSECLPGYLIRVCKWLALLARVGFGSPVHGLGPPA